MQTCKWTVQVGQATSFIRIPDPLDVKPVKSRVHVSSRTEKNYPIKKIRNQQHLE